MLAFLQTTLFQPIVFDALVALNAAAVDFLSEFDHKRRTSTGRRNERSFYVNISQFVSNALTRSLLIVLFLFDSLWTNGRFRHVFSIGF